MISNTAYREPGTVSVKVRYSHYNALFLYFGPTPTDRPKSVRNRFVIEVLVAFLC